MTGYSDEDVETAAQVLYKRDNDMVGIPWERLTERHESTKDIFRRDARAVLDAVAPSIAARAWDEGYQAATAPRPLPRNPYTAGTAGYSEKDVENLSGGAT